MARSQDPPSYYSCCSIRKRCRMISTVPSNGLNAMAAKLNPAASIANPVRIGVIGCGYWGTNYVRVFNELLDSRVVALCDQRPERLQELAGRLPGVDLTTQIEEVASRPD